MIQSYGEPMGTILQDIKTSIGVDDNNLGFDQELLLTINAVKSYLVQLGVSDFDAIIVTKSTAWPDLMNETLNSLVKQYLILKTKQLFDPIASEPIARVFEEATAALEGRIGTAIDDMGLFDPVTGLPLIHTHSTDEVTSLTEFVNNLITLASEISTLGDMGDVNLTAVADGDILTYFAGGPNWVNMPGSLFAAASSLSAHIADQTNPHNVTAAQVGAALSAHTHSEDQIYDLGDYLENILSESLESLSNVEVLAVPEENDLLAYDAVAFKWKPRTASEAGLSASVHNHVETDITDLDKYTQAQVDAFLAGKAATAHGHVEADISDLDKYSQAEVEAFLAGKAALVHTHDEYVPRDAEILQKTGAYTITSGDAGKTIFCSGTFTITLPDGLDSGFQVVIVNKGSGVITLSANTTLNTKESAVTLSNQYGAASIMHEGSNIWYAWGDLS